MTAPDDQPVPLGVRIGELATSRGDQTAVTCAGVTRTWAELDRRTNLMARGLQRHGAAHGSYVTIALPNSVEFIEACIACWKIGAVPQPVSARLPALELHAIVELADPAVVITAGDVTVERQAHTVDELLDGIDDDSPLPVAVSPAWKAPTSGGSTGRPKLIVSGAPGVYGELTWTVWRHRDDGVALMPGPMYHNGPFSSAFQGLMQGSTLVLMEWFGAEKIWELYAGTEAQAGTLINGVEWLEHRGSVGKVAYGEMVILDDDGNPLPPGEVGEVFLKRSPGMPPSYRYVGAEARKRGEWESLGDVGWMDADGYLYLADRHSDMILVGGSNVYPAEVEAALDEHPHVRSSAVIGLPDDDLGQVVHAIVQADPSQLDLDDLRAHLAQRLVRYKHPRKSEF